MFGIGKDVERAGGLYGDSETEILEPLYHILAAFVINGTHPDYIFFGLFQCGEPGFLNH